MKKVVVLCKGRFEALPPVMTVARVLRELAAEVTVVCSESAEQTKADYEAHGVTVLDVCPGCCHAGSLREKASFWRRFRAEAHGALARQGDVDLLWIGNVDTAMALGRPLLRRRFVLHALELHDKDWIYRRLMKRYMERAAAVVVPELSRACIFRSWYGLEKTPFVLPNKPANHPRRSKLDIQDERARGMLATLRGDEKIVLYQGGIRPYSELRFVAEAVQTMGDGWRFAVMGSGSKEYMEVLKKISPSLIHISRVAAPYHLQVTSHAYIGVVTYSYDCLNFVFCAPNKTWEYAGFGLPMICNDLPPLRFDVQANGAGLCVDMRDIKQIKSALREIDDHYESFSQGAHRFYDTVDIRDVIRRILETASLRP